MEFVKVQRNGNGDAYGILRNGAHSHNCSVPTIWRR